MTFHRRLDALQAAVKPTGPDPCNHVRTLSRRSLEAVVTNIDRFEARRPLTPGEQAIRADCVKRLEELT